MFALDPWTIVTSVLFVVLLVLLYLRRRSHTTVSFRLLGRVMVSNGRPKICPHLGQADDPFIHQERPSPEHRCYLWMQRDRIDMSHQKGFCLSVAHQHCPWLTIGNASGRVRPSRLGLGVVGSGLGALAAAMCRGGANATARALPFAAAGALGLFSLGRAVAMQARTWSVILLSHLWTLAAAATVWAKPRLGSAGIAAREATTKLSRQGWASLRAALARDEHPATGVAEAQTDSSNSASVSAQVKPAGVEGVASLDATRLIQEGKTAGMAGNRKMAYACFSLAAELDARNDEVWLWKAAMADKEEEKQRCLETALALNPANTRARAGKGQFASAPRAEAPAAEAASSAAVAATVPVGGKSPRAKARAASADLDVLEQGLAALERGEEEQAYQLFKRATELNPGSEKAWFWRAKSATSLAELIACLEHALAINPDNEKVKSNLAWAMDRLEREQKRRRYAQPFAQVPVPIAGGSHTAQATYAYRPAPTPADSSSSQHGRVRWIAGVSALLLACYWLWGALVPITGLSALPGAAMFGLFLPSFAISTVTWYEKFQLLPGYNLLEMVPYVVGFLFIFVARGLFTRERWALLWGILLAAVTVGGAVRFVSNPAAVIVAGMLCMSLVAGILVSKREFVP